MRVHRHPLFLFTRLLGIIIFGVLPVGILFTLGSTQEPSLLIVAAIWGILILIAGYFIWYRYRHDEWIITNQRLVDSLMKHWFHQQLVSTDLINIEDMSVSKSGVLQTLFNYGDLRCETAGHAAHFVLHGIPDPSNVLDTVDTARDEARQKLASAAVVLQAT